MTKKMSSNDLEEDEAPGCGERRDCEVAERCHSAPLADTEAETARNQHA